MPDAAVQADDPDEGAWRTIAFYQRKVRESERRLKDLESALRVAEDKAFVALSWLSARSAEMLVENVGESIHAKP